MKTEQQKTANEYSFPHNWSDRQYFIHACFVDDLQAFYKEWEAQGRKTGRIQFFSVNSDGYFTHKYWIPSKICCESGEILTKENADIKVGYWIPNVWKLIRKDLLSVAKSYESLECQKIDCSCNDCKFLDRAKVWCTKLNKQTKIEVNLCHPQNQSCFEHRKS